MVRDEHELHDALLTLVVLPPVAGVGGVVYGAASERTSIGDGWSMGCGGAGGNCSSLPDEAAVLSVLRGWMDSIGPVTPQALADRLGLPLESIEIGLAQLESEGGILRGRFSGDVEEFCHRRVLARIHRMTLGRLRKEIEPVTAADFMRFLTRWQHTDTGTRLHGADGLLQVLRQLQG